MDRKIVRSDTLESWCHEAGGKFYDRRQGPRGGYFGCDVDGDRIEINRRSGRPNNIMLKSQEKGHHQLGLSKDADLVSDEGVLSVETTETTLGTDDTTTGLVEGGVRGSKIPTRQRRESQKSMWRERRRD